MSTSSRHRTVFTTPSDTELVATRTFDAPQKLLWEVHTEPKHLRQWCLGPDGWSMPICEVDLRPGGRFRYVWQEGDDESTRFAITGEYREVTPFERLVNTEQMMPELGSTLNTTTFTEEGGRTTVRVHVQYPSKEIRDQAIATGMEEGWAKSYDRLDEQLAAGLA